jgi:hypothetical protein
MYSIAAPTFAAQGASIAALGSTLPNLLGVLGVSAVPPLIDQPEAEGPTTPFVD